MEGMAMRLVPKKNDDKRIEYIDEPILRKQLLEEPSGFSKDYLPGFKFRGLNDKSIFFDENHERLTQNYRNAFIRLAIYYQYKEKNSTKTLAALDAMEKKIPRSVVPMDYRIKHDISKIYFSAGGFKQYEILAREVIDQARKQLELNPRDFTSWYNPYDLLLTHYENLKMYKEAITVLQQLQSLVPGDQNVAQLLSEFRKKAGIESPEFLPKQLEGK
jgi:tetratricopeptide (TPR) repeat protein